MSAIASANFHFLHAHSPQLVRLGTLAEHYFKDDPNTCLIKLRQFGELLAQTTGANAVLFSSPDEPQADLLRRLQLERILPAEVAELFHHLRRAGNRATHDQAGDHAEALACLKVARQLGIWFHRTFGTDRTFAPGPFVPPPDPAAARGALQAELARLRQVLDDTRSEAARAQQRAEGEQRERANAEERAAREREDRLIWEQLAQEAEQARAALAAQLAALQATASMAPPAQTAAIVAQAAQAADKLDLDEAATRALIDAQLRNRGWEADSETLRYSPGVRPARGHNMAIAEWPTANGPADYALFIGTRCIGMVEAKRRNKNVAAVLHQAERYAAGFQPSPGIETVGGPRGLGGSNPVGTRKRVPGGQEWPGGSNPVAKPALPVADEAGDQGWPGGSNPVATRDQGGECAVPFVFSTNGRPYLKQIETLSGIWFRDTRRPTNLARALTDWPTPEGLQGMLDIDVDAAQRALQAQPFDFGFPLRPYQRQAIETVEAALAQERRAMLLAMATGTGKTKLAIALLYRLLSARRFRRVCFVVDRNALGQQAAGEFRTTRIVSVRTFADIFDLKEPRDVTPDPETRVHICTIQGLVKRVLYAPEPADVPPVDHYDLLVIDECHRGYLLDRELSDAELSFRGQDDYISKYRRVLEHFNAMKIGLTATPALHTVDIFGKPIFTYAYRDAVIDGYLVDHEPPIRITTALSQGGITFTAGEMVELLDVTSGELDLAEMPDELHYEVDAFNKLVVTQPFNRVVVEELR